MQTACSGPGGQCAIVSCLPSCFDLDRIYSDGCECCAGTNAICAAASNLGTVLGGGQTMGSGELPQFGGASWFTVTFMPANGTFHPQVVLAGDVGLVFDANTSCSGTALATATTSWNSTSATISTVYVKVYRAAGLPTCNTFTLAITNG
jgi:hypothetical protein